MLRLKMPAKWSRATALSFKNGFNCPLLWQATKTNPPPPPPPTQCYPLYSFYSPPHSTIRQRINCRSASFFGSCFATVVPHLSGVTTHDSVLQAIGAVFFRRSRLFVLFHPSKPIHQNPSIPTPIPPNHTKSSSRYQK